MGQKGVEFCLNYLKLSWLPSIKNNNIAPLTCLMIIIFLIYYIFIYIRDLILIYFIK